MTDENIGFVEEKDLDLFSDAECIVEDVLVAEEDALLDLIVQLRIARMGWDTYKHIVRQKLKSFNDKIDAADARIIELEKKTRIE